MNNLSITPNYNAICSIKTNKLEQNKTQHLSNTCFKGGAYRNFNATEFAKQNKGKIAFTSIITGILSFLGIRKQSQTEKAMLNLAMVSPDDNEKQTEALGQFESAILSDLEKEMEIMQESNEQFYTKHPEIRKQIENNVENIRKIIQSDSRLCENPTMKNALENWELQQFNFSRDENIGIDKMTEKANAQIRFMKEYLQNEKLNSNSKINNNLYMTFELIDSNRQVDFILNNLDKHQNNIDKLLEVSFKFFGLGNNNQPSDEFAERFVSYLSRNIFDKDFYACIYKHIQIPQNQEEEKNITRAIDFYFGGAMPFEKMYNIINDAGYIRK